MKAVKSLLPFRKRHSKYYPARSDWFDELWREEPATLPRHQTRFFPEIDVIDNDGEYKLKANLPGWQKKDLDLTVNENAVILRGKHQEESRDKKGDYLRQERRLSSFERRIGLSETVKPGSAKAQLKNGILEVMIPKAEPGKTRKKIPIDTE
jgi:HSP20 family molecular chaperone IbpA